VRYVCERRGFLDNYPRFHLPEFSTPLITERVGLWDDEPWRLRWKEIVGRLKGKIALQYLSGQKWACNAQCCNFLQNVAIHFVVKSFGLFTLNSYLERRHSL